LGNPFSLYHSDPQLKRSAGAVTISGLHIVANFSVEDPSRLIRFEAFREFIYRRIEVHGLCKVGEVFHNFETGGYTAVVCLTESHLSIHTWPENNYLTFDIFLSNYLKDNRAITRGLYEDVKKFFQAIVMFEQTVNR
jgi:S-adenosylmethionine decarboxylase